MKLPMDYGVLCLAFLLFGWHPGFLGVYTFLAVGSTGYPCWWSASGARRPPRWRTRD